MTEPTITPSGPRQSKVRRWMVHTSFLIAAIIGFPAMIVVGLLFAKVVIGTADIDAVWLIIFAWGFPAVVLHFVLLHFRRRFL